MAEQQKELFRTSILIKLRGCLCLISVDPTRVGGKMECPQCKCTEFRRAPHGWLDCCGDECDFAMLESHVEEIKRQFGVPAHD